MCVHQVIDGNGVGGYVKKKKKTKRKGKKQFFSQDSWREWSGKWDQI